jgi:type I restriction enzyme R subunit
MVGISSDHDWGKVPFSKLDKLLKEVIEQAEGQYGEWPLLG